MSQPRQRRRDPSSTPTAFHAACSIFNIHVDLTSLGPPWVWPSGWGLLHTTSHLKCLLKKNIPLSTFHENSCEGMGLGESSSPKSDTVKPERTSNPGVTGNLSSQSSMHSQAGRTRVGAVASSTLQELWRSEAELQGRPRPWSQMRPSSCFNLKLPGRPSAECWARAPPASHYDFLL